jgi:hypothetical protein
LRHPLVALWQALLLRTGKDSFEAVALAKFEHASAK